MTFDLNTGTFSDSWSEAEHKAYKLEDHLKEHPLREGLKLITYECLNDESFQFYSLMKVVTATKNK